MDDLTWYVDIDLGIFEKLKSDREISSERENKVIGMKWLKGRDIFSFARWKKAQYHYNRTMYFEWAKSLWITSIDAV